MKKGSKISLEEDKFYRRVSLLLKSFRKQQNYTQQDMCDILGIFQSRYYKIEKGEGHLSLHEAYLIAKHFKLNPFQLLFDEVVNKQKAKRENIKEQKLNDIFDAVEALKELSKLNGGKNGGS